MNIGDVSRATNFSRSYLEGKRCERAWAIVSLMKAFAGSSLAAAPAHFHITLYRLWFRRVHLFYIFFMGFQLNIDILYVSRGSLVALARCTGDSPIIQFQGRTTTSRCHIYILHHSLVLLFFFNVRQVAAYYFIQF